jgi:CRP/FNR family transcriptional regulator
MQKELIQHMSSFADLIGKIPLFEGFDSKELNSVSNLLVEKPYTRGTTLFVEGDIGEECYIIKSGIVKIYRMDDTREVTLDLLSEGDYLGEMAMMRQGLTRSATADVMEDSWLYILKRSDFISFLEEKPQMCLKLLEGTMDRLRKANEQIYDLTFLDLRARITKAILRLAEAHGVQTNEGLRIPINLTHQQVANLSGADKTAVSILMAELQNDKVLEFKDNIITIHKLDQVRKPTFAASLTSTDFKQPS